MNLKKSLTAWKQKQDKMDLPQRLLEENLEDGLYILLHYFANNIFVYLWVRIRDNFEQTTPNTDHRYK